MYIFFSSCSIYDRRFAEYFYFWLIFDNFLVHLSWICLTKLKIQSFLWYIQKRYSLSTFWFLKLQILKYEVCWWICCHTKRWRVLSALKEAENHYSISFQFWNLNHVDYTWPTWPGFDASSISRSKQQFTTIFHFWYCFKTRSQ